MLPQGNKKLQNSGKEEFQKQLFKEEGGAQQPGKEVIQGWERLEAEILPWEFAGGSPVKNIAKALISAFSTYL